MALLGLPALAIAPADPLALRLLSWQPQQVWAEPWRCWSAAWVHLTPSHRWADLAGLALVGALGVVAGLPRRAAWAWALAWPLLHLTLQLQPQLTRYVGLSGVLYAGAAVVAVESLAARRHGRMLRWVGLALLVGLLVRVGFDRAWERVVYRPPGWDFSVAPLAHAAGIGWGAVLAAVAGSLGGCARRRDPWEATVS